MKYIDKKIIIHNTLPVIMINLYGHGVKYYNHNQMIRKTKQNVRK